MTSKVFTHISFSQINKRYPLKRFTIFYKKQNHKLILNNAEIELKGGECILLTGKNGSGKSTLLRILAGLLKPDSTIIHTGLESLPWNKGHKLMRQQIMYLHQEPYMFDGSVLRNLEYATNDSNAADKIEQALQWANLIQHKHSSAKCLSGGEKQKVALAQAWLKQPSILLLDEPTANMDEESQRATEELLLKFKQTGIALLIASHDINHFHQVMDKRLLLKDGKIIKLDEIDLPADKNITLFPQRKKTGT